MSANATYIGKAAEYAARSLQRAGLWDLALELPGAETTAVRAGLLTDRFFWQLDQPAAAEAAVTALAREDPTLAGFYEAQLAYTRLLFGLAPRPDDDARVRAGFTAAAQDQRLVNWATLWIGIVTEKFDDAPQPAKQYYTQALDAAVKDEDLLLESYAIRHLGGLTLESGDASGLDDLRRSYQLRAALGARPQTAAAAATYAAALPPGAEAEELKTVAARTARELGLTWLIKSL
ncbi:hypothetical protein Aab01nite_39070 [Paractinoplanes abujensis]|uniref:Tetratricopeptide repeat protein n=1 Tax=Paractinoplanes abujensis TaxID=882441 RepID=A0A7W7CTM6_9ACTN|nr:hypothetical protein [Actinoplanes abujensis]MBB4694468.1 hypothetical protein [Actinoplanes abujensis]GID20317.1 hypothetical protein Aab01nite_39070 [Actinoplanes abujensis]